MTAPEDITRLERKWLMAGLGLSEAQGAKMTMADLRYAYYKNPPAGGGGGGLDLTNSTGTLNADKIVAGTTNAPMTASEKTKLSGIATGATANSSDATLLNRANHTGTQSLDTTVDSASRTAMSSSQVTKLSGIATGATANDTDANLKNRANHTGTQTWATISDAVNNTKDVVGAVMTSGVGITYSYNSGTKVLTSAADASRTSTWNGATYLPARDADTTKAWRYDSTKDAAATAPTDAITGDIWTFHPDSAQAT